MLFTSIRNIHDWPNTYSETKNTHGSNMKTKYYLRSKVIVAVFVAQSGSFERAYTSQKRGWQRGGGGRKWVCRGVAAVAAKRRERGGPAWMSRNLTKCHLQKCALAAHQPTWPLVCARVIILFPAAADAAVTRRESCRLMKADAWPDPPWAIKRTLLLYTAVMSPTSRLCFNAEFILGFYTSN